MVLTTVIDFDSVVYFACCSLEKKVWDQQIEPDDIGAQRQYVFGYLKDKITSICNATDCDQYIVALSGLGNFRYGVCDTYKHNRAALPKPPLFKEARRYLIKYHEAHVADGMEADDYCRILALEYDDVIIAHIDKDLDMIVGSHYNYTTGKSYEITERDSLENFYMQLLTGDATDGISGLNTMTGQMATKALKAGLLECETEWEMWHYIVDTYMEAEWMYGDVSEVDVIAYLTMNAQLLWLLEEEGQVWEPPK